MYLAFCLVQLSGMRDLYLNRTTAAPRAPTTRRLRARRRNKSNKYATYTRDCQATRALRK